MIEIFFLQTFSIVRYKILELEVGKHVGQNDIVPCIYFKPNIHKNGPEILRVNIATLGGNKRVLVTCIKIILVQSHVSYLGYIL
jgi:hypothetical protein